METQEKKSKISIWKKWWFWIIIIFVIIIITPAGGDKKNIEQETQKEKIKLAEQSKVEETKTKEIKILQEQKIKAENITKTAVDLITEDKISEAITLYNNRWNELAKLRVDILYDNDLTDLQKKNIDKALETEQESITSILSKFELLYPASY